MTRKTVRVRSPRLAPAKKLETLRSKKGVYERGDFIRSRVRDLTMVGLDQERAIRIEEAGRLLPVENLIGFMPVPVGVADHFVINGRKTFVPMATLERGVVAGASHAAKLCKPTGGFTVKVDANVVVAQIRYDGFGSATDADRAADRLNADGRGDIVRKALTSENPVFATMRKRGGGLIGIHAYADPLRRAVDVDVKVNALEAMGANLVTRIANELATEIGKELGGRMPTGVIVTNAVSGPDVIAKARWRIKDLGPGVAAKIVRLQRWAETETARATTHNKGVLNGLFAAALATGQDVPAIAAAAEFEASCGHIHPSPLTTFREGRGTLIGEFRMCIPLGTVGGATQIGAARTCRQIMGARSVRELAAVIAAAGLATNFASLRMLADEGLPAALERLDKR